MPSLSRLDIPGPGADSMAVNGSFAGTPPATGNILTLAGGGSPGSDHVAVVARLVGSSRQVVLDIDV